MQTFVDRPVLVCGATGLLGREVVAALKARGRRVRVLTRSAVKAGALQGDADVVIGDAMRPETLTPALNNVSQVVSCVGAPVSMDLSARPGYLATDPTANAHLIDVAKRAGVERFVYVSVHAARGYDHTEYVRAHLQVEDRLRVSGLSHAIVQPTGLYPVFDAFVEMARRGFCSMPGDGTARTNPVHPADVATACVDALEPSADRVVGIGGPDVLTRQQIVEMAFHAVGTRPRITHVPPSLFISMGRMIHPLHPRLGELLDFAARAFTNDSVAPALGTRPLAEYLAAVAARRP